MGIHAEGKMRNLRDLLYDLSYVLLKAANKIYGLTMLKLQMASDYLYLQITLFSSSCSYIAHNKWTTIH